MPQKSDIKPPIDVKPPIIDEKPPIVDGKPPDILEPVFEEIHLEAPILACALKAAYHPNSYDFDPLHGHEAQKWPDGTIRVSIKLQGNNGHKIIYVKLPERYPVMVKKED